MKIKLGPKTKKFRYLCALHARAWIACLKFSEAALGEKRLEEMDHDFYHRSFFPANVLREAKKETSKAYHAAGEENGTHK